MRNLVLQRSVAVQRLHVVGMISRAEKRAELLPVLLRADERGKTSADDAAEHLFFERQSRRVVAERLLQLCVGYRLLTETAGTFTLTSAGAAALASEQVFVPERGNFAIWASDDPLLAHPILRLEPWDEPTAYDEVRGKDPKQRARTFVDVPELLRAAEGRIAMPPCSSGESLRVDGLERRAEQVQADVALRMVWDVGAGALRLEGRLEGNSVNAVLDAPAVRVEDVWRELLEGEALWPRWDETRRALRVGFDETGVDQRESLLRDLELAAPMLAGRGAFAPTTVPRVPVFPRTAEDAGSWAAWRLEARLQDYATTERFRRWCEEAKAPFDGYPLAAPRRADLAREAWADRGDRPSPVAWHLVAAEDWSL